MDNIFEVVRDTVPLLKYLNETGIEVKHVGEGIFRVNPCPFCGHRDCCTLYDKSQTFTCFSCGNSGDVIHLERHLNNLSGNLEAARSLATKYGVEDLRDTASAESEQKAQALIIQGSQPSSVLQRQRRTRKFVAEYYHQQLMRNQSALHYQMHVRGHSIDVLRHFLVGMAGGDLIAQAAKSGVDIKDLVEIGIVKETKNGYRAYIPNGLFVYPHWADDDILSFTIKDPAGERKFQLPKKFADPEWFCFNQDAFNQKKLIISEGENDALSIIDKGRHNNVIATIGNFNTTKLLEYLSKNSNGKTYYLAFDRDEAGEKYTSKYSAAIEKGCGQAYKINIPSPHKDIDDYLRAVDDPKLAFSQLLKEATLLASNTPQDNPPISPDSFTTFHILGELSDGRIAIWSRINKKIYQVALKNFNLDQLDQIGGQEVTARVSRQPQEGKLSFKALKRALITEAAKTQLGNPVYFGQGIHKLNAGTLLLVIGGASWIWNGQSFLPQEAPFIEHRFIDWQPSMAWIDSDALFETVRLMKPENGFQIIKEFLEILSQWRFKGSLDLFIVCGWFLAQIVQTVWDWRPHLWFCGAQGSGKTLLTLLFEKLGGQLARRYEGSGSSEAGIRQDIGNHTVLITLDEFEKTRHRDKILELCRSASRGGTISKGSSSQSNITYRLRHMFFLCSIELGIQRAAENPRYLIIESMKDPTRSPQMPSRETIEQLRLRIFAYAIWAALKAKTLLANVKPIPGIDPRFWESLGVAFSMLAVCDKDPTNALNNSLRDYCSEWRSQQQDNFLEDEQRLLEDIMMANIRLPLPTENRETGEDRIIYDFRTVAQLLEMVQYSPPIYNTLQANGIKVRKDGVFLHPDKVKRELLQNTDWGQLSIREIILRVKGATSIRDRIAGSQVRGVLLPNESLSEYFGEDVTPAQDLSDERHSPASIYNQ